MEQLDGHTKYVSFKNNTSGIRLKVLHLNAINNIAVKFEYLTNYSVYDKVEYLGKKGPLKQILLQVTENNEKIFTGVEQGSGKNTLKVFILMKPNKQMQVRDQIANNVGLTLLWKHQ